MHVNIVDNVQWFMHALACHGSMLGHITEGIPIIKQRLHTKKVLLILDDVDKLKQLRTLVGELGWLGPGSRVIV
ncbi:hypothetical protein MTR_6g074590 [Medicago truncatula]|uniref:P-loop containing nucleoside triphosphate hydrolase n=1 Tax=Medicago truncatula TaxID=3880 RepID=G7KJ50_MEDTR|nr:hypothetical protein MTR_6g074590 [Medicago truncatula]